MVLKAKDLQKILDTVKDGTMPVRVYTSYNMYTVIKVVVNKGRLIIFTGETDNLEPVEQENKVRVIYTDDDDDPPWLA